MNIVTVGGGLEGYTATFSGNVSNRGAGGGVFGTVKSGKLTFSARYNYNYNNQPRSYSGGNRRTVGETDSGSSDLDYSGTSKGNGTFQSGSMEASYEIDTLRLVTMSFGLWGGKNKSNGKPMRRPHFPAPPTSCTAIFPTTTVRAPGIPLTAASTISACSM